MSSGVDSVSIINALTGTLNQADDIRKAAEAYLNQASTQPGYLITLFKAAGDESLAFNTRQAAFIRIKTICNRCWVGQRSQHLSDEERAAVRSNIIPMICNTPQELLRNQLVDSLFTIVRQDYPDQWPEALSVCIQHMTNPANFDALYGAVESYNQLLRVYRTSVRLKDIQTLNLICEQGISIVINHLKTSLTLPRTEQLYAFIHLALKSIAYALTIRFPKYFKELPVLDDLLQLLITLSHEITDRSLTDPLLEDYEQRAFGNSVFKYRKWSLRIIYRIVGKRLKPSFKLKADAKKHEAFIKSLQQRYSESSMQLVLTLLQRSHEPNATPTPPYVYHICYSIICSLIRDKNIYIKYIKPNMNTIIGSNILNTLKLTKYDIEEWIENPQSYVLNACGPILVSHDHRSEAEKTLCELIQYRTKTALPITLTVLTQVLDTYNTQIRSDSVTLDMKKELILLKDSALRMICVLHKYLSSASFHNDMINLINTHVLPELTSYNPQNDAIFPPVLQVRCLNVLSTYCSLPYTDANVLVTATEFCVAAITATDIPLRYEAVNSLQKLLYVEQIVNYLRPNIKSLFEKLFTTMDVIEGEYVGLLLRTMIEQYDTDLIPLAYDIVSYLMPRLMKLISDTDLENAEEFDEEADEKYFAAQQYLDSIYSLLLILDKHESHILALEPLILPCIHSIFDTQNIDFIQNAFNLLQILTYYPTASITPAVWEFYPKTIRMICDGWGEDCFEYSVPSLCNYISLDMNEFLSKSFEGVSAFDLLMQIPTKIVPDPDKENSAQLAVQLVRVLVGYADNNQLNNYYLPLAELIGKAFIYSKNIHLNELLFQCIAAMFYFQPVLAMQSFNHWNFTEQIFTLWMNKVNIWKDLDTFTYSIAGIGQVLQVCTPNLYPPSILQKLDCVIGKFIETMVRVQEIENQEDDDDVDQDDDEVFKNIDSDYEDNNNDDDDNDNDDEDTKASTSKANLKKDIESMASEFNAFDEFDDDDEGGYAVDSGITTLLDDVNLFTVFLRTLESFVSNYPTQYTNITSEIVKPDSTFKPIFDYAKLRAQEFDAEPDPNQQQ